MAIICFLQNDLVFRFNIRLHVFKLNDIIKQFVTIVTNRMPTNGSHIYTHCPQKTNTYIQ
jgi:hypothetical protein